MIIGYTVHAQETGVFTLPDTHPCTQELQKLIAKEQRQFRRTVYGYPGALHARTGTVRFDRIGSAWLKTASDEWSTWTQGRESILYSNDNMNAQAEFRPLTGIVEQRQLLTTELITSVSQAFRALHCRLEAICALPEELLRTNETTVDITPIGCQTVRFARIEPCTQEELVHVMVQYESQCNSDIDSVLTHETELIKLTTSYDAGYRSLLQFAGIFDAFLEDVQEPLLAPLTEAMTLLKEIGRIPCFLSQCDG